MMLDLSPTRFCVGQSNDFLRADERMKSGNRTLDKERQHWPHKRHVVEIKRAEAEAHPQHR